MKLLFLYIRRDVKRSITKLARQLIATFNHLAPEALLIALFTQLRNIDNKINYYEFSIYPKKPKSLYGIDIDCMQLGVILQGPIYDFDFVYETVKWYKKCGIQKIVVSTETRLTKAEVNTLSEISQLFTLAKPLSKGVWNENSQMNTTHVAVEYLQSIGLEYAVKTRTDQRIYNEFSFSHILHLLQARKYATKDGAPLIVLSNNSSILKTNNICDHLYASSISNLVEIFDGELRDGERLLASYGLTRANLHAHRESVVSFKTYELEAEQWLYSKFLAKVYTGESQLDPFKAYLGSIINALIVLDPEELDLFWTKSSIMTLPVYYYLGNNHGKPVYFFRLTSLLQSKLKDSRFVETIVSIYQEITNKSPSKNIFGND